MSYAEPNDDYFDADGIEEQLGDVIDAEFEDVPNESAAAAEPRLSFRAVEDEVAAVHQTATENWNRLDEVLQRAWKKFHDNFIRFIGEPGSPADPAARATLQEYVNTFEPLKNRIFATLASQERVPSRRTPARRQAPNTRAEAPNTSAEAPNTSLATAGAPSFLRGLTLQKVLPWLVIGGIGLFVFLNRKKLFKKGRK